MTLLTEPVRAVDTPPTADLRGLDGDPDDMFPLLNAKQVGEMISFSTAYVHQLWQIGAMPYVLWPVGKQGRGAVESEARRRRMRSDHLREAVIKYTVEMASPGR